MFESRPDRFILLSSLMSSVAISLIFNMTSPEQLNPAAVVAVFILLYAIFFGLILIVVKLYFRIKKYLYRNLVVNPKNTIRARKSYLYIAVISFLPILFIAMQSIKSVGIYELLLMMAVIALACFYVYKR